MKISNTFAKNLMRDRNVDFGEKHVADFSVLFFEYLTTPFIAKLLREKKFSQFVQTNAHF